jgi:hypothetical protein
MVAPLLLYSLRTRIRILHTDVSAYAGLNERGIKSSLQRDTHTARSAYLSLQC